MDMEAAKEKDNDTIDSERSGLVPILQALLLSASDPIPLDALARVCEVEASEIEHALFQLAAELREDSSGFELVSVARGYQFRTKAQYGRFIRALREDSPRKLSGPALETLAVIAYRQPVVKHDIDGLRGVDVMPTLKTLLERNLIHVSGHRETVGRPALYSTTEEFLRVFGLNSLEDLPTIRELNLTSAEPGELGADAFANPMQP